MIQFKRISPPLPPPEVMQSIYETMLDVLMATPPDQWDEYVEEPEPLENLPVSKSEFINNVCPECGGVRTATINWLREENTHYGHHAHCRRWLKSWRYKDVYEGQLI